MTTNLCCLVNPVRCFLCKISLPCEDHSSEFYIQTDPADGTYVCKDIRCREEIEHRIQSEYGRGSMGFPRDRGTIAYLKKFIQVYLEVIAKLLTLFAKSIIVVLRAARLLAPVSRERTLQTLSHPLQILWKAYGGCCARCWRRSIGLR